MAIVRFNPWSDISTLQRQIDRLFDDVASPLTWNDSESFTTLPRAELQETDEAIALHLEVPGINVDDLDIEVTEDTVSVKGERKSETQSEENGVTRSEFRYGSFHRIIPLPARVQNTQVTAEYKNGILHLHLPKTDAEKNKVVKVSLNGANESTNEA